MKVNNSSKGYFYIALVLSPMVLLSGCKPLDWVKDTFGGGAKKSTGVTAIPVSKDSKGISSGSLAEWGDGKIMVTQQEFDSKLALMRENPELKGVNEALLPMLKAQLLTSMIYEKVIGKWIEDNKIDKSKDYQNRFDQYLDVIKNKVNIEFFTKELDVEPSKSEKKEFYEERKDRIALISRGGVKAVGVKFEDQKVAKAFYDKVSAKGVDFDKIVNADATLKSGFQDFNYVNKQSRGLNPALKKEILETKKVPAVELVKVDDKTFWVIEAKEKEDAKYRSYKEVEETVEAMVKQIKQGEVIQKKLEELKTSYGVKTKENAFGSVGPQIPVQQASGPKEKLGETAEADKVNAVPSTKAA